MIGLRPMKLSLDDYYLDRDRIPVGEDGRQDFERLEALDVPLFNEHLVRLLSGDIRPEQFMTGAGEEDGFFDALANGPVSATDPRALGGDLVGASLEPRR